ncbi:MAG: hypothetical protein V1794_00110 [Candidatus Glassbacteria bacterium]
MGCPACKIDYGQIEKGIERGEIRDRDRLLSELALEDLFLTGDGSVAYCPSCRETIQRLLDRVASRLRKETLANIGALLDKAHEARRRGR